MTPDTRETHRLVFKQIHHTEIEAGKKKKKKKEEKLEETADLIFFRMITAAG